MPDPTTATDRQARVQRAFAQIEAAIQELADAHRALPDDEYSPHIPSMLCCGYNPPQGEGSFHLLGHVDHLAAALEHALADPHNLPFREALMAAMEQRFLRQVLD